MNITTAKQKLTKEIKGEYTLEYENGNEVEPGERVIIYGRRVTISGNISWQVKSVHPADADVAIKEESTSNHSIEEEPAHQQLVLEVTITEPDADSFDKTGVDEETIEVIDRSPIRKNKDRLKELMVLLCRVGWSTTYMNTRTGRVYTLDEPTIKTPSIRPIRKDDFKVTTVRKQGKAMHFGYSTIGSDYRFKLGVKWWTWHNMNATEQVKILTHELCHAKHQHHKKSFYREHAAFVNELSKTQDRREIIQAEFEEPIDWQELKAKTLEGVHDQPQEIDISGFQNRREASVALTEELGEVLEYNPKAGRLFHIYPKNNRLRSEWVFEAFREDADESVEELRPDYIEMKPVRDLEFDAEKYSDEELFEYHQSLKRKHDDSIVADFVYDESNLPVVEGDTVVENEMLVCLFNRFITPGKHKEGLPEDVEIETIPASTRDS